MAKPKILRALVAFSLSIGFIAGFALLGLILFGVVHAAIFVDGAASIVLLTAFSALFWFAKLDWRKPEIAAGIISFTAFFAMFFDSRGNPVYNQPLAWLFGSPGSRIAVGEIISHGGGSTGVNYDFKLVDIQGAVEGGISSWIVIPFRFFEYLLILSLVVTIITLIRRQPGGNRLPR